MNRNLPDCSDRLRRQRASLARRRRSFAPHDRGAKTTAAARLRQGSWSRLWAHGPAFTWSSLHNAGFDAASGQYAWLSRARGECRIVCVR